MFVVLQQEWLQATACFPPTLLTVKDVGASESWFSCKLFARESCARTTVNRRENFSSQVWVTTPTAPMLNLDEISVVREDHQITLVCDSPCRWHELSSENRYLMSTQAFPLDSAGISSCKMLNGSTHSAN